MGDIAIAPDLKIGRFLDGREEGDPAPKAAATDKISAGPGGQSGSDSSFGVGLYAIILVGGLTAYFAYSFLASKDSK